MVPEISVQELKNKMDNNEDFILLDVREPSEVDICKIDGSVLIPLGELEERYTELDSSKEIVVQCKLGGRSANAVAFLHSKGIESSVNLAGGIIAWAESIDTRLDTY